MVSVFVINWCSQFFLQNNYQTLTYFFPLLKQLVILRTKWLSISKENDFFFFLTIDPFQPIFTDEINNSTIYCGYHWSRTLEVVRNVFCRYYIRLDTSKQSYLNFSSRFTELKHLTKGIVFHLNLMYLNVFIVPADIYWMLDVFMTTRCCNIHYIN